MILAGSGQLVMLFSLFLGSLPLLFAQVPVIDLSRLGKDVSTSQQVDLALQEFGLFIAENVMSSGRYEEFFTAAESLFAINDQEKDRIKVKEGGFMRGYIPFGHESGLKDEYFEPKEGFSYGYSFDEDETQFLNGLEGENVWPDEKHFDGKNELKRLFDISTTVSINIARSLSASYKHHTNEDLGLILDGGDRISIMRLFHYFAKSTPNLQDRANLIGSSPHTDWGLLTVITQQMHVGGLQVHYKGKWIDVPSNIPGSVIVNGGDFLSILSKGRYKSPVHRVQSPEMENRISFVYFFYPNFHSPIDLTRSSTQGVTQELKEKFNTLVSADAVTETVNTIAFGDFIINKWKGVFNNNEE